MTASRTPSSTASAISASASRRSAGCWARMSTSRRSSRNTQTLFQDLLKLYAATMSPPGSALLKRLKLRPLNADKPKYVALSAMAAPTSPFKQMLESVRDETQLTKERPARKKGAAQAANAGRRRAGEARERRARPARHQPAAERARRRPGPGGGKRGARRQYREPVQASSTSWSKAISGAGRSTSSCRSSPRSTRTSPSPRPIRRSRRRQCRARAADRGLRANSSRYPAPFDGMIVQAVNDFEGDATGATVALLRQALADQVSRVCADILTNRYPFVKASTRDVPLADFARLFAPGGIMDKFYKERLEPYVDSPRRNGPGASTAASRARSRRRPCASSSAPARSRRRSSRPAATCPPSR
jgi:type VI secretion system protein ImpL